MQGKWFAKKASVQLAAWWAIEVVLLSFWCWIWWEIAKSVRRKGADGWFALSFGDVMSAPHFCGGRGHSSMGVFHNGKRLAKGCWDSDSYNHSLGPLRGL